MEILVVVDMQKDFVDGSLGTKEAVAIVPNVVEKIKGFAGKVYYTKDTHEEDYLKTQEGKNLPVKHCIKGTPGWELTEAVLQAVDKNSDSKIIEKPTFGSTALAEELKRVDQTERITKITLIGLCTDICVISNALMLKAHFTEVPIAVDATCCAGVTPQSHTQALEAMKMCQIIIENA